MLSETYAAITAMMRQIGKQILTLALALLVSAPALGQSVVNTTVTDPLTGVALDGYDAVTYFIEPAPLPGSSDFVHYWAGVPWYFASAANRDVFARNPEIYAPRHGGYCEMSLARGFLSDGKPQFYVIEQMKLYLFYSAANREAFLISKAEAVGDAEKHWAELSRELTAPREMLTASP
jgi:hypothetical protein